MITTTWTIMTMFRRTLALALALGLAPGRTMAAAPLIILHAGSGPSGSGAGARAEGALALTLNANTLLYQVSVAGKTLFDSSGADDGYGFSDATGKVSLGKGMSAVGQPSQGQGKDATGPYTFVTLGFARDTPAMGAGAGKPRTRVPQWIVTFKAYTNRPAIVFAQQWPKALSNVQGGSIFPSLRQANSSVQLGTLEYTGSSCGFMVSAMGEFPGIAGGEDKGYVVIAPRDTSGEGAGATLVVGPVTEHFANQASNIDNSLAYGLGATFESVPAGFKLETVLTLSTKTAKQAASAPVQDLRASIARGGVNGALVEFGDFLLDRHGKTRARGDHVTETEYIGYSTTGYYFYNLCDCLDKSSHTSKSDGIPDAHNRQTCTNSPIPPRFLQDAAKPGKCGSYQDTLIAVNAALKEQGIPIKHFLLDSWWYGEGWNNGVALWEDTPACTGNDTALAPAAYPADTFPLGLIKFRETVGMDKSIWVHNGMWNAVSPYRKDYPFAVHESQGPPQGPELWQHLFKQNAKWGLSTIKQDHIRQQVDATKSSYTNVTVLKSWMAGMGDGATANNISVLYCCAEPNIHMNGVTVPAAYAVRSSPDYVWGVGGAAIQLPTVQWAIGPDAAFHWLGLGLLPYKDTFISNSSSTQKSGRSWTNNESFWPPFAGYHETNAATHALMSLLSMAHVTFADAVGETNGTLIMQLIREDGMLLKADRPVTAIDAQFQAMMFGGWPGKSQGPAGKGSLYTAQCDENDPKQQFVYACTHNPYHCVLKLAGKRANEGCLTVQGGCFHSGDVSVGADVRVTDNVHGQACGAPSPARAAFSGCSGHAQDWQMDGNVHAPRGGRQVSIRSLLNSSAGVSLCLELNDGGAKLATCDPDVAPQGWLGPARTTPGKSFQLRTTEHDDSNCLTVAGASTGHGAFHFASKEDETQLADELFPRRTQSDVHQLSDQYRSAYTMSAGLMRKIKERRLTANAQCKGNQKFGAPQGPLGEVYSTHTTVGEMTWRYVVGVQLAASYNVTRHDLVLDNDGASTQHVIYRYDETAPGFKPVSSTDILPVRAGGAVLTVLTLHASTDQMCDTSPDFKIKTQCFPFQLHCVAPVASNGWVLTGETGKFVPISNQRIASVEALSTGGFTVSIKGSPGETVEMGAADTKAKGAVVYASTQVRSDGTATLHLS